MMVEIKKYALIMVLLFGFIATGCSSSQQGYGEGKQASQTLTKEQPKAVEKVQTTWNTEDMDVTSNGNVPTAIDFINKTPNPTEIVDAATPAAAFKAPWKYYGKIVKATGLVAIVQEFPPGSDIYKMVGGDCGEVVFVTDDGTFIDYLQIGSTGSTKVGDTVTLYGTPAGQVEVDNKMGGKTTELFIVGKTIEVQ